jgi:ABC-type glycerol-3-phosphate transport system substrate-binding protein
MSNFKIALFVIFSACILIGVLIFASSNSSTSGPSANLLVWGTVSSDVFDAAYEKSSLSTNKLITISYVKKDSATFDQNLVEALADGVGPDIILIREDSVYKNRGRIFPIPYENYTERDFRNTFFEGGELFLSSNGVMALPFMLDPMVMYWNRDVFSNNFIAQQPKFWDEVYPLIEKTTRKDTTGSILQSTIALGEWGNIGNAKEIVAMLLLQAGTPITSRTTDGASSVLNQSFNKSIPPSQSAINFYTQFSNPTSPSYSWNRSLPSSLNSFLSGNLAVYLGFGSEISFIQQKNANLNFDVSMIPQIRDANKKIVFGHIFGLSIVKQSKQIAGAFTAINALTEPSALSAMETVTNLPPVHRDLLSIAQKDPFRTVFYNSALIAHSWIDPDATKSTKTFRDMIESITSGKSRVSEALSRANDELDAALR